MVVLREAGSRRRSRGRDAHRPASSPPQGRPPRERRRTGSSSGGPHPAFARWCRAPRDCSWPRREDSPSSRPPDGDTRWWLARAGGTSRHTAARPLAPLPSSGRSKGQLLETRGARRSKKQEIGQGETATLARRTLRRTGPTTGFPRLLGKTPRSASELSFFLLASFCARGPRWARGIPGTPLPFPDGGR